MKKTLEKRIHQRKPLKTKIVFDDELGDGLFYVYSKDISLGGLYLASNIPVRLGTFLFLSFQIPPHKRSINIVAEVVRHSSGKINSNAGMGIRFVGLPEPARKWIENYLAS